MRLINCNAFAYEPADRAGLLSPMPPKRLIKDAQDLSGRRTEAVPTRMQVAPSGMALLIVAAHAHTRAL